MSLSTRITKLIILWKPLTILIVHFYTNKIDSNFEFVPLCPCRLVGTELQIGRSTQTIPNTRVQWDRTKLYTHYSTIPYNIIEREYSYLESDLKLYIFIHNKCLDL